MSAFTPERIAEMLALADLETADGRPGLSADGGVLHVTIASDNKDGESSHRNVEHFHAVVLPGAHDPARFLVDEKRMTGDRCGGWLLRLDDGVTLDEILAAASTHECAGEGK